MRRTLNREGKGHGKDDYRAHIYTLEQHIIIKASVYNIIIKAF